MSRIQFSDVQLSNLSMLVTIRDGIKRDQVSACCQFGLDAEQASFFDDLSFDHMLDFVAHIGHECLFPPRQDLFSLLRLPLPLAGPIASVHSPHKVASLAPQKSPVQRPRPS